MIIMAKSQIGFFPEFIIHPGETLIEVLEEKNMTQCELATRTEVTPSYVNKIIQGSKNISTSFAKKLEYVLGIDAQFWINLQSNYDKELYEYQESCEISEEEKNIVTSDLREIVAYYEKVGILRFCNNIISKVIELRKIFQVSKLTLIPNLKLVGAYRHATNVDINPYVMYAWRRLCELRSEQTIVTMPLDVDKLKNSLDGIKELMFIEDANAMIAALTTAFSKCGIIFSVVRNFKKAPVQGFIKKNSNGSIILCMTIRKSFADIFWFTLFHEIAHIINGDYDNVMIDYERGEESKEELAADDFASNILISVEEYNRFIDRNDFSIDSICKFSEKNKIKPYILIGRLQKQNYIPYTRYTNYKTRYKWCDD